MADDQRDGAEDVAATEEEAESTTDTRIEEEAWTEQIPLPPQASGTEQIPSPSQPPLTEPIPQPAEPPAPADRWRAAAVALLNLSGLGLGYVLLRRWAAAAVCWVAIGILLLIALPADPNGVPGGLLIAYLIFLVLAAVHGAARGLRSPLKMMISRLRRSPVAAALALVLLVVPGGGVVLYNQAHDEAVQRMLLGRLDQADRIVAAAKGESFTAAGPEYRTALATYRDLLDNDHDSRAGKLVPDRLAAFYQTVASPYAQSDYCQAIAPLTYLRTLPQTIGAKDLGSLATWPDDRLATSLYQCGAGGLGTAGDTTATTDLSELLATFPASAQAAKVEPAVAAAIKTAAAGINGSNPCTATTQLHTLGTQVSALTGGQADTAASLRKDAATAGKDVESGTYACGVSQYKSGKFTDAETTMTDFVSTYPHDPNHALAQKYSIAAQIAQQDSAAGKTMPTLASGGSVTVTILNDSPDPIKILYTGPATGSISIGACGKCTTYSSDEEGQEFSCTDSSIDYPQATIRLPAGTTYFLHESTDDSGTTANTFNEHYDSGDTYTDCAYETDSYLSGIL
jgi:hypothetical protein